MQPAADFWGEFFGPSWTAQGVAVIISATLALLSALISALVAMNQGSKTRSHVDIMDERLAKRDREYKGREHWWVRFKSVVDDLVSGDSAKKAVALVLLEQLAESSWASDEDRRLVVKALDASTAHARKELLRK